MKEKRYETFWVTMFFFGFLFIFGVSGGLDQDTLTLGQAAFYAIIGFSVMIVSAKKGGFWQ